MFCLPSLNPLLGLGSSKSVSVANCRVGCTSRRLLAAGVCLPAPAVDSLTCLEGPAITVDVDGKRLEVGFQRNWIIPEVLKKNVGEKWP